MDRIESYDDALKLARMQAKVLRAAGYAGVILPKLQEERVELLASKVRMKTTLHLTFHPTGVEAEVLPVPFTEARQLIEA